MWDKSFKDPDDKPERKPRGGRPSSRPSSSSGDRKGHTSGVVSEPSSPSTTKKGTEAKDDSKPEEAANRQEAGAKSELTADKNDDESTRKLSNVDRSPERRRGDRYERGGRGRGRGGRGAYMGRPSRHNIKSDLTTQEESDDPVAIRKQVGSAILAAEIRR